MKRIIPLFHILTIMSFSIKAQEISFSSEINWLAEKEITYELENTKILSNYPNFENFEIDKEAFLHYSKKISFKSLGISENKQISEIELSNYTTKLLNYKQNTFFKRNEKNEIKVLFWSAKIKNENFLIIKFNPTLYSSNKFYGITNYTLKIHLSKNFKKKNAERVYANNSMLSSGNWYKIKCSQTGIYKITYEKLKQIGFTTPENVRVFGTGSKLLSKNNADESPDDLKENKIWKLNESIYFYAIGPDTWNYNAQTTLFEHSKHEYSDAGYYFLSDKNTGYNNDIESPSQAITYDKTITDFNFYTFKEQDIINFVQSGRTWYGEAFDIIDQQEYPFIISNINAAKNINFTIKAAARALSSSSLSVNYANQSNLLQFSAISGNYEAAYANDAKKTMSFSAQNSSDQNFILHFNRPSASAKLWIDYIEINCFKFLKYENANFSFRNSESIEQGKIARYEISNINTNCKIWNISNKGEVQNINYTLNNSVAAFNYPTDKLEEFLIFEPQNALTPDFDGSRTGKVENQNLHSISQADMLIISAPAFLQEAKELAEFHENIDALLSIVVNVESVYNEFSNGTPDISAIKNFVRMVYEKSKNSAHPLRLLTLFGDGSYKNKQQISENWNMIPTYQSINSISPIASYVSDDYYGILDSNEYETNGTLDIGIGRIPVDTKTEAQNFMSKVKNYYSAQSHGAWKNIIALIADDEDGNTYYNDAQNYSAYIEQNYPTFNLDKIYLDAFKQVTTTAGDRYPDVVRAINERMQKGCLILNYIGHGNEYRLAHEKIIDIAQINDWDNFNALPVFMTATCEFSRFDNSDITSAGEQVLLNKHGGSIGMFTTTRLVFSGSNDELNTNFYKNVFQTDSLSKKQLFLGDIVRYSKLLTGSPSNINKRNFSLLGDPALRLLFPTQRAKITQIQNQAVTYNVNNEANLINDTIKALTNLTIKGIILDNNNQINNKFTGTIIPSVYDKKMNRQTLANDGGIPQNFTIQNNRIFKGKASITNGEFTSHFIVPKDINLAYGNGKISLYFYDNNLSEGKSEFNQFIIGGIDTNAVIDKTGPEIELYLNEINFIEGGLTNQNPVLYAHFTDSSGINTSSASIGHDISAILDNNSANTITLNNFYEAELDNFKKGKVKYQLSNLTAGEHSLKIKVWDAFNNSSEKTINFIVADDSKLEIRHLFNYPNPFFSQTAFYFEHNSPNIELNTVIQIFSISGKLVKTIRQKSTNNGYISSPIFWDGKSDYGQKIGRGTYFYRLSIQTPDGKNAEKIEKLVILN